MRITDIDEKVIQDALEQFYQRISGHIDQMTVTIANRRYSLPRVSRRRGHRELPYFYAVDLEELFDYALGRIHMQPAAVEERCETIMMVLFRSPSGQMASPNWDDFAKTPLGLCILACGARMLLRQDKTLTANQVMLLASWTPKHLKRSGLIPIDPSMPEPHFHANQVVELFQQLGVPV